jgi:hypothetical protein
MTKPHRDLINHQQGHHAMTSTAPRTSAQAITMIATLQIKREGLVETIDGFAERRREFSVAAELGDDVAALELQKIEAEEARARSSLQTLDFALHEVALLRDKLAAQEANKLDIRNAIELDEAISGLLELDDEIDDSLDHARALLAKRADFKREKAQVLRRQPGKMLHAMLGRDSETAESILSYFDKYLAGHNAGRTYASLTRISEFDSRYYGGRPSPRMLERGPRNLSPFEKTFRKAIAPSRGPIELRQATRR